MKQEEAMALLALLKFSANTHYRKGLNQLLSSASHNFLYYCNNFGFCVSNCLYFPVKRGGKESAGL